LEFRSDIEEEDAETELDEKALIGTGKAVLVLRLQLSVISWPGYGFGEVECKATWIEPIGIANN